jgi:protein ImuB
MMVSLCCDRATRSSIRPGMPLAEARALNRHLSIHEADPRKDMRALEKLAAWAERYSPIVGLEEGPAPECLLLDITGCAACFHGEDKLIQRAVRELSEQGWIVRAAVADTIGAAWGLAHHVRSFYVVPPDETEKMVLPLPVAALRLPAETVQLLAQLGIQYIHQLMDLPRDSLPTLAAYGLARHARPQAAEGLLLQRLDQALGRLPELIVPCRFRPEVQARCSFEYPTDRRAFLHHALDQLLERVVAILGRRHRGARRLECWIYHETAPPERAQVDLVRPSRSPTHLGKLLRTRLEQVQIAEPVSALCLRVPVVEVMPERQFDLFDPDEPGSEELSTLIDHLVGRLGREAVTFPRLVPDPQPEYACRFESPVRSQESGGKAPRRKPPVDVPPLDNHVSFHRPLQVWPEPVPIEVLSVAAGGELSRFRRAGQEYAVVHAWGPERIETGWWRGQDIQRDYYIVETDCGTRWWLFRRRDDGRWFMHGCFD